MQRTLAALSLILACAAMPASAKSVSVETLQKATYRPAIDTSTVADPSTDVRKDVIETLLPPPPHGPATYTPFCTPAQAICP